MNKPSCELCGNATSLSLHAGLEQEIRRLRAELASVREDAERWKHVLAHHCRAGSPHMDNTWAYYFSGPLRGRWETPEQAIDAAIAESCGYKKSLHHKNICSECGNDKNDHK